MDMVKLYRQNIILNDFVNFLKARGRFREIEFIENSVHATPRIPDLPSLVFYIEETRSEQHYTLEIHGDESAVMNREIQDFFKLNQLDLINIKIKYDLLTELEEDLIINIEGIGDPFTNIVDQIITLLRAKKYTIKGTKKTLVFSKVAIEPVKPRRRPLQIIRPQEKIQSVSPTSTIVEKKHEIPVTASKSVEQLKKQNGITTKGYKEPKKVTVVSTEPMKEKKESTGKIISKSIRNSLFRKAPEKFVKKDTMKEENDFSRREEKFFGQKFKETESKTEDLEANLFHQSPPSKSYSSDVAPYLKQTSSLFRRDNWEEDLPTEFEMDILERTYMRIKHRTKPEILAKDINVPLEDAENLLRSLISKGLLRTQVGWYIIKKSHLPFFKRTFAEGEKKKKKKKSPRISRVGEGFTPEEISTIRAIKSRPNLKAQSNLLTRPTGLKQSVLKEVLRNLVDKGILRVSYGWYILKDKNILELKRGVNTVVQKESKKFQIPKGLVLKSEEERVIQALLSRPHFKAQSNLLTSDVKMPKEQIKQVLRDLVEKNICKVTYGWYMLKNPEKFQVSAND
jgi:DNA-binding MarR family transcriptional regulator